MDLTVIVPTFNEAPNIAPLLERLHAALLGIDSEVVFVDDSTDTTPDVIGSLVKTTALPVRLLHRAEATGGLSGAVVEGLRVATGEWCVVMDGDLQHPPEVVPTLLRAGLDNGADAVVASRHVNGGSAGGLNGGVRHLVSLTATILAKAMFPVRLRNSTDPMTGFFAIKRDAINIDALRPRGFKILLEILTRNTLTVIEEPFVFAQRNAGESKATFGQGIRFITQLAALRFGRLSGFGLIGGIGALANLAIMAGLESLGVWYIAAATVAAAVTISGNFVLQERFVFNDLRAEGHNVGARFLRSFAFNGTETVVRTTLLWAIVEWTLTPSLPAQAFLLALGFVLRFVYHSRVVYRPRATTSLTKDLDAISDLTSIPEGPLS